MRDDLITKILSWAVAASLVACVLIVLFVIACYGSDFASWP